MIRLSTVIFLPLLLGAVSLPQAADARTAITGVVKSKAGKPLSGMALTEKGEIHNNIWYRGALVDAQGRFTIELEEGGPYGLHVYSSGYLYSPQAVLVETGKTLEVAATLVPETTRASDPHINRVGFFPWEARQGKITFIKLDVVDPNNILGPQVLAFNAATGRVYAMDPPTPVKDLRANFPSGVYQIGVDTAQTPINPRDWHFVVADHQCNTTDILSFPHVPKPPKVIRP
jgi:carboxypeptidase family protein